MIVALHQKEEAGFDVKWVPGTDNGHFCVKMVLESENPGIMGFLNPRR